MYKIIMILIIAILFISLRNAIFVKAIFIL